MEQSRQLFKEAKSLFCGGVNSPVRAFKAVNGTPVFFKEGKGAYLYSEDGKAYIDYVLSWGPLLFGHAHKDVVQAIIESAEKGTTFGAPSQREIQLGRLIQHFFPSCQKIRFVNSGTEATMSALRLARGATRRKKIVKFNGSYHGHSDSLLIQSGSGGLTFGIPDSLGVLPEAAMHTLTVDFNDFKGLEQAFTEHGEEIAAIIVEPVCGNMGVVLPVPGFLPFLRELCDRHGSLLIFDEVITGFRVHPGGAQALYGVVPDLTCLGKVIGGGLPCGAYGGRKELMDLLAPEGPVYQAGTLSGNPVVMAAGTAMLARLKNHPDQFEHAAAMTHKLVAGIQEILREQKLQYQVNSVGTIFTLFFTRQSVRNLKDVKTSDTQAYGQFFHRMLQKGIYLAPSAFEANFISSEHGEHEIALTLQAIKEALHA
jgi:glutamate-1-semialdehyde 2,1-aminomutase